MSGFVEITKPDFELIATEMFRHKKKLAASISSTTYWSKLCFSLQIGL